jgi:hypothetical protein
MIPNVTSLLFSCASLPVVYNIIWSFHGDFIIFHVLHCLVGVFFEACIVCGIWFVSEPNLFPSSATALWGGLAWENPYFSCPHKRYIGLFQEVAQGKEDGTRNRE